MNHHTGTSDTLSIRVAAAATAMALVLGLAAGTVRSREHWRFPSWPEQAVECVWMFGLVVIAVLGFRLVALRRPTAADLGLARSTLRGNGRRIVARWAVGALALLAVVILGALSFSGTSTHPVIGVWSSLDEPRVSTVLWVFMCLVRWPVSTIAQQVLYFGWLQPRLSTRAPLLIAALLYAGSHVATPAVLPFVLLLGLLFAYERERSGRIYAGIATHYAINVALYALGHR